MAPNLQIGRMRNRLKLRKFTGTQNTVTGGYDKGDSANWTTIATLSAAIRPLSGKERFEAAQVKSEVTHEITMRYNSNITEDKQLLEGTTRVFEIAGIINVEDMDRVMIIQAVERT